MPVEDDFRAGAFGNDRVAQLHHRGVLAVERPEQARFRRGLRGAFVVQRVDERTQPQRVRQQYELLPVRRALLPDGGKEPNPVEPLLRRQIHFARKRVQMPDQRRHNLFESRIGVRNILLDRRIGDRDFVDFCTIATPPGAASGAGRRPCPFVGAIIIPFGPVGKKIARSLNLRAG